MLQMIDPPGGYLYGFPIPFLPEPGQSIDDYLLVNGYPQSELDRWPAGVPVRIWTPSRPSLKDRPRTLKDRRRLSGAAIRTFINIAREWRLSEDEEVQLVHIRCREYKSIVHRARKHRVFALPTDRLMRISAVFNIYSALMVLFSHEADRGNWLRCGIADEPFQACPPLDLMMGKDIQRLLDVAAYLQARLAGSH